MFRADLESLISFKNILNKFNVLLLLLRQEQHNLTDKRGGFLFKSSGVLHKRN
jgi:hypothetical protein